MLEPWLDLRYQQGELRPGRTDDEPELTVRQANDRRRQRLDQWRERIAARDLARAPAQHREWLALGSKQALGFVDQPRRAEAGRPLDDDRRRPAVRSDGERGSELLELAPPANKFGTRDGEAHGAL